MSHGIKCLQEIQQQENGHHSDFGSGAHIFGYLKKSSGAAVTRPESRMIPIKELT
jgi:hypothetical protein